MKTSKSIINVIDSYFDEYKGIYTPYEIETNTTLLSFFKKTYAILKSEETFEDARLVETYINCTEAAIKTIRFIENSKIYKFKFTLDPSKDNSKAYAFLDCVESLSNRYTNRNYDQRLLEEEQKIGYNNYYNENIYISKGLVPSYNENKEGSVEFKTNDNPYLVKICSDGSYVIWTNEVEKRYTNYESFKNQVITMEKDDSLLDFYQTVRQISGSELNTEYFVTFAFEDGFTVNANNEYEQNNGLLLELFQYVKKSFESRTNVLENYLKLYFYSTLVEKYRTKEIIDKETHLKANNLTATNNFLAIPKVYERLNGKAGRIGCSNTIDYDVSNFAYPKFPFGNSILKTDGKIYFYINKNFLKNNLNLIKKYNKIDYDKNEKSFLYDIYKKNSTAIQLCESEYTNYFDNINDNGEIGTSETGKNSNKQAAKYIKLYGDKIKEQILKQNFFAITPKFIPDTDTFFTSYYLQNVKKIEKEYYYDENYDNSILDVSFDESNMILSIQTNLKPEANVNFGGGVLNTRKTQQKFYDNIVSNVSQSSTTSKDSNFKSKEFSSLFDDRETVVVSTSDTIVVSDQFGYSNVRYDETGKYLINSEFPEYKNSTLYKKGDELWLDCTNFADYNDINSINQVRIIFMRDNRYRFLFNVDRVETEYISTKINILEIDAKPPSTFNISYVLNDRLVIGDETIKNIDIENEAININDNVNENIYIQELNNDDYSIEFSPINEITESYFFVDEIIFNKKDAYASKYKNDDYILVVNGENKEKVEYKVNKYLVLKNNSYVDKYIKNENDCQILDFISTSGNSKRKELGQYVYRSKFDNTPSFYEEEHEKTFLKLYPEKSIIGIYNNNFVYSLKKQNILPCYNKQTMTIKVSNKLSQYKLLSKLLISLNKIIIEKKEKKNPIFIISKHVRVPCGDLRYFLEAQNLITKELEMKIITKPFGKYTVSGNTINCDNNSLSDYSFDFRKDKFFIMYSGIGSPIRESIIFNNNTISYDQIKQISIKEENEVKTAAIFKLDTSSDLKINVAKKYKDTSSGTDFNLMLDDFIFNSPESNFEKVKRIENEKFITEAATKATVTLEKLSFELIKKKH